MIGDNVTKHSVTVNGQEITYEYTPEAFGCADWAQGHFAFRSEWVSPTVYRSWFVNAQAVRLAGGHQAAATKFIFAESQIIGILGERGPGELRE